MKLKNSDTDFNYSDMPSTRRQVFLDVYKNRFWLVLGQGALLFVFLLPFLAVYIIGNVKVYETNLMFENNLISSEEATNKIFALNNAVNLLLIPCLCIFAVGLSGVCGLFRKLVWQEPIMLVHDFGKSLKANAWHFIIAFFIIGLANYLLRYCLQNLYFSSDFAAQAALCASLVFAFLIVFITPLFLAQTTVYNLPVSGKFKNSFLLSMRAPLKSLIMLLLNVAPYLLLLINNQYLFIGAIILLPLLVTPMQILSSTLICDSVLDEYVNKENFTEIYKKGLYTHADHNND